MGNTLIVLEDFIVSFEWSCVLSKGVKLRGIKLFCISFKGVDSESEVVW